MPKYTGALHSSEDVPIGQFREDGDRLAGQRATLWRGRDGNDARPDTSLGYGATLELERP
jgi:hypothetical protein